MFHVRYENQKKVCRNEKCIHDIAATRRLCGSIERRWRKHVGGGGGGDFRCEKTEYR